MTGGPGDAPRWRDVVVVGPCASGKSALVRRLRAVGLPARAVAQEHSVVTALWRHQGIPDAIVYLAASPDAVARRGRGSVGAAMLAVQEARLADARRHAAIEVDTDPLTADEVAATVLGRLRDRDREGAPVYSPAPEDRPPVADAHPPRAADPDALQAIARRLRRDIIEMTTRAGSGHPSSSMSAIDIIVALYRGGILALDPSDPRDPGRDRFILSKGHAAPALYAILAEHGVIETASLATLREIGSPLEGHPNMRRLPGVEASTGSLGQGLSIGLGHALAGRLDGRAFRTYVMCGDGEMQEGQVWEAIMAAAHYRADTLTLVVDHNGAQQSNLLPRVIDYRPLAARLRAFDWHVEEIDGHDMPEILGAFDSVRAVKGRPQAIVAHTVKGKGVSFVEADWAYHGKPLTAAERDRALAELGAV